MNIFTKKTKFGIPNKANKLEDLENEIVSLNLKLLSKTVIIEAQRIKIAMLQDMAVTKDILNEHGAMLDKIMDKLEESDEASQSE